MGHLNGFFAPMGGNLNKPIFKNSNARGGVSGGRMLKLRFDWYITTVFVLIVKNVFKRYFEAKGQD